ncbi:MarR family winged helix-turn-helix transcriptional regulator [Ekhidna sp.]
MRNSFDPKFQEEDLTSKIVVGIERLSEVFRVLLWEKSKETGLSPIQIQILLFLKSHDRSMANVSHLSKEFNLKKPTISDAVKVMFEKRLIDKETGEDARRYTISLTARGARLVDTLQDFDSPLRKSIEGMGLPANQAIYDGLVKVIFNLNQSGIIEVQRTCYGCQFHQKEANSHYCGFINKELKTEDLRLDCTDFKSKSE